MTTAEKAAPTVTITEKAADQVRKLAQAEKSDSHGLRVAVQGGGCSGLVYKLGMESQERPEDKVYEQHGVKLFIELARKRGFSLLTAIARTGGGGFHFLFGKDEEIHDPNQQGLLVDGERIHGIDVRGEGGYIVAPPSVHASGKRYEWFQIRGVDDLETLWHLLGQ